MTAFEVGDKVRYTGNGVNPNANYIGVEGVITYISGWNSITVKITKDSPESKAAGRDFYPRISNIEKIEEVEFAVGDRVEFLEDVWDIKTGTEGTVAAVSNCHESASHGGKYLVSVVADGGQSETVFDFRIKKIEKAKKKAEPKFNVGDKVTVKGWETSGNSHWEGRTGTVKEVTSGNHFLVQFDDGNPIFDNGTFVGKFLEPYKPFGFEDIKVGDKIKRTRTFSDGTQEVVTGKVDSKSKLTAHSSVSNVLAFKSDTGRDSVRLELLERPEPKPEPKLWENREAGDVIVREVENALTVFIKQEGEDERWSSIYLNNKTAKKNPEKGYDWVKTEIADALGDSSYKLTLITA